MDDGQKVITIAHPEHSSGELKSKTRFKSSPTVFQSCISVAVPPHFVCSVFVRVLVCYVNLCHFI